MKKFFVIILLFCSMFVQAQDVQNEDSARVEKNKNFQLYIAPGYALNQFVDTYASFIGVHLGISYKNKIDLNVYYSAILDDFKKQVIFPETYDFAQKNLGVDGQYAFLESRIKPHVGVGFQFSNISWLPENDNDEKLVDYIYFFKPYIGVSWRANSTITAQIDCGYMITPEVELTGLTSEDFNGLIFNFMIKIGFYNF